MRIGLPLAENIVVRYTYIVLRYIVKYAQIAYKRAARPGHGSDEATPLRPPRCERIPAARILPLCAAQLFALQRVGGREGRPDGAALPGAPVGVRHRRWPRHHQRSRAAAADPAQQRGRTR